VKKRKLFAEITEGFEALAAERISGRTLRAHTVEMKPVMAFPPGASASSKPRRWNR
jgi:hypothetical protein